MVCLNTSTTHCSCHSHAQYATRSSSSAEILRGEKLGQAALSYWNLSQRRNPHYGEAETAKIDKLCFQIEFNCQSRLCRNPASLQSHQKYIRIHKLSDTLRDTVIGYPSAFSHFKQGKRSLPEWFWRINISKRASEGQTIPYNEPAWSASTHQQHTAAAIPMLSVRPASAPFLPQPDFSVAEILCREKPGDSYWIGLWQTNSCKGSNDIVSQRRNPRYAQAETAQIGKLLFQMELNCRSLLWTDSSRNPLPFNPIKSTSAFTSWVTHWGIL